MLAALLGVAFVLSLALGQYYVALGDLVQIMVAGPDGGLTANVVWQIRLPRILLGFLVGACLGVAGTLMQAVFANPLAEPSIVGVTSGAGVGAAVVIVFNISVLGTFTVPLAAFATALLVTALIYQLARSRGRVAVVNLILTGIAINAVCNAIISFMMYLAPTSNREQIIFWQMGSLNGSQWKHVWVVLPIALVGMAIALCLGRQLDVLALGERAAEHTGVDVKRLRIIAIAASAILTAAQLPSLDSLGSSALSCRTCCARSWAQKTGSCCQPLRWRAPYSLALPTSLRARLFLSPTFPSVSLPRSWVAPPSSCCCAG